MLTTLTKRGANLLEPELVKEAIARQQKWSTKTREIAVETYACFLKMQRKTWEPPKYKFTRKLPFIPTETEIDQLIAGCSRMFTPLLQLLKETGIRIGEASAIRRTDIDFENSTVRITPEKGSNPRMFQLSNKLKAMLLDLQGTRNPKGYFQRALGIRDASSNDSARKSLKNSATLGSETSASTLSDISKPPLNTTKPKTSFMS